METRATSCTLDALIASRSFPGQAPDRESARPTAKRGPRPSCQAPGQSLELAACRAPVAQLDSASVFGTEGWGFESLRAYFLLPGPRASRDQKRRRVDSIFCCPVSFLAVFSPRRTHRLDRPDPGRPIDVRVPHGHLQAPMPRQRHHHVRGFAGPGLPGPSFVIG
jgi:hypothetical protein